jgi:uncharacterized membrane protein
MEIGFLNSILRSAWMPPLDPFFAGGFINYYYYGHFVVACVIKLVGVDPRLPSTSPFHSSMPSPWAALYR